MSEMGIVADRGNNFEFVDGVEGAEPAGVFSYSADEVPRAASGTRRTLYPEPLTCDLILSQPGPKARGKSGWPCTLPSEGGQEIDISAHTQVSILRRADRIREVRVRAGGPVYDEVFGGVSSELGADVEVFAAPATPIVRLDRPLLSRVGQGRVGGRAGLGRRGQRGAVAGAAAL